MKLWGETRPKKTPYSDLKSCCRIPQDFSSSRHADLDTGVQQAFFSSKTVSNTMFIPNTQRTDRAL
jgi:hypothetical protein